VGILDWSVVVVWYGGIAGGFRPAAAAQQGQSQRKGSRAPQNPVVFHRQFLLKNK